MKKVFSTMAVLIFMRISTNAKTIKYAQPSSGCEGLCLDIIDAFEETFGCMSAEEATEIYQILWETYC